MHAMTKEFLEAAFAGESMAHMKYVIFSEKAEKEGRPNLARLFRAIAYAEQVHAANHFRELGKLADTSGNLETCIEGEHFEVTEMYPVYNHVAELQSEKGAVRSTHYALEAEKIHERMYADAKATIATTKDLTLGTIFICPVCGYTVEGSAPEFCPVCAAKRDLFRAF
ncbi:MAG: rubrerythrin family protein [Candidatus Bipolaricaulis sp.]|nr:rubrerythrin family protein [Candidatus Bipolaricaulis sp.]MDD5647115.1 rubrerythrin family protein [Candidatus Bipolaricaulis sp.]